MAQILLVLGAAALAGVAAYGLSIRMAATESELRSDGDFLRDDPGSGRAAARPDLPPGYRYAVLGPPGRSWQTMLVGFLGIVVLISFAALALALSLYEVGHLLRVTLDGYVGGVAPSPSG